LIENCQFYFIIHSIPFEDFADILNNTDNIGLNFNDYFSQTLSTVWQEEIQNLFAGTITPQDVAEKMQLTQDNMLVK